MPDWVGNEVLIPFKQIPSVYFLRDIIQSRVVAVGDDGGGAGLESSEVVDDLGAKEGGAVGEGGFVDDHGGTLGLNPLHDALNGGLAEVVRVSLHRQAEDADHASMFTRRVVLAGGIVVVVAGFLEDLIRDKVFAGAVGLDDGFDQFFRDVVEVGQELLGVFRQTISTIPKTRVIVMRPYSRVQTNSLDDGLRIQAFHLGVRIKLVEITHSQRQISIREQFDGFGLGGAHQQDLRVV